MLIEVDLAVNVIVSRGREPSRHTGGERINQESGGVVGVETKSSLPLAMIFCMVSPQFGKSRL